VTDPDRDPVLYPNAGADDASPAGPSRRGLLAGTAAVGVAAAAGCTGSDGDDSRPTVFVFNTGDGTVTVVDAAAREVVGTADIDATSSFPSNQYAPRLADGPDQPLWINVGRSVRALSAGGLGELADVGTDSGANWLERTPDGAHLVVSAREPTHAQFRVDADPGSESFGDVTGRIDRADEGGRGDNDGPGPCDVTIHPDGEYAFVPDIFGDTLTVLDVGAFEIETQVDVDPAGNAPARPWMATAAWDGERMLVEHDEGETGTESVWDVSDPVDPEERVRLTAADGLGERPLTSEIGPDSETGYVFTPGSEDVTVVDLAAGEVTGRIDLGGAAFVGTWDPARECLYVPVQTAGEVAVIDHERGEVATRLDAGPEPYGATAATVRPDLGASSAVAAAFARLGVREFDTTYCLGNCACGHTLE
jgi:DNA-binding beta-propeller fold protein YncE